MIVYVVATTFHVAPYEEQTCVSGAFSSLEAAKEAAKAVVLSAADRGEECDYSILECGLDSRDVPRCVNG